MQRLAFVCFSMTMFFVIPFARGEVRDLANLEEAIELLDQNSLLIFNLDTTLLKEVPEQTPKLIEKVQGLGIKVLGVTSRSLDEVDATHGELVKNGIDFNKTPVLNECLQFTANEDALFNSGILYVGPKNEMGLVLSDFLARIKITAKKIVFVDQSIYFLTTAE